MNTIIEKTGFSIQISKKEYNELRALIKMSDKLCAEAVPNYFRDDESKAVVDMCKKFCKNLNIDSETERLLKKKNAERKQILKSAV